MGTALFFARGTARHTPKVYAHAPSLAVFLARSLQHSDQKRRYCWGADAAEMTDAGSHMPRAPLISLVEDDSLFRDSMTILMKSLGYTVKSFSSAADFLASPHLIETACVIADVQMPAMSGLELHKHLVEVGCAIPTILVTAYPNDADRASALDNGVACYLRKPVDEKDLIQCLRTALRSGETPERSS